MKALYPLNFTFIMRFLLPSIRLAVNSRVKAFLPSGGGFRNLAPSRPPGSCIFPSDHRTCLQSAATGDVSSNAPESSEFIVTLSVSSADDLEEIGALLAIVSSPPDVVFLDGDLGAGKTTLARGFVLCKLGVDKAKDERQDLRVTSPTYLLSNTYCYIDDNSEQEREIHHMDLYRLQATSQDDFAPLQLGRVFDECISLIEWPSRLADFRNLLPSSRNRLNVYIDNVAHTNTRRVQLVAQTGSTWIERLQTLVSQGLLDDLILPETRKS